MRVVRSKNGFGSLFRKYFQGLISLGGFQPAGQVQLSSVAFKPPVRNSGAVFATGDEAR
jgi:hypothetical protein